MRYVLLVLFLCLNLQAVSEPIGEETVASPSVLTAATPAAIPDSEPLNHTVSWDNKIATALHAATGFLALGLGASALPPIMVLLDEVRSRQSSRWFLTRMVGKFFLLQAYGIAYLTPLVALFQAYNLLKFAPHHEVIRSTQSEEPSEIQQSNKKLRKLFWGSLTLMSTALFAYWILPMSSEQLIGYVRDNRLTLNPNQQAEMSEREAILSSYWWRLKWVPLSLAVLCSRSYLAVDYPRFEVFLDFLDKPSNNTAPKSAPEL